MKKYRVTLTVEERRGLQELIASGKATAKELAHARILLKADAAPDGPGWADERIAEAVELSVATVERVRRRFVEQGLEAVLDRKPQDRPSRLPKLDGRAEARLVALALLEAARGSGRVDDAVAGRQAGRRLDLRRDRPSGASRNELKPWLKEQWCLPPESDAEFVAAMEDVLDVYHRPFDPARPMVCIDEASKQLIGEVAEPVPAGPGRPERIDYEYTRNGTANLFMVCEPLIGWRHVDVTDRRTAVDFAEVLRWIVEDLHPDAEKVVMVMDNLNTHKIASLYEAFEPERARRIAAKLEIHHSPKHGSWLNMAECELSALGRQCLGRRIESRGELRREVAHWELPRNERGVVIQWQFTTADARIKLRRLYPTVR